MSWKQYRSIWPRNPYGYMWYEVDKFEHKAYRYGKWVGRKEALLVMLVLILWWVI